MPKTQTCCCWKVKSTRILKKFKTVNLEVWGCRCQCRRHIAQVVKMPHFTGQGHPA
jgi:hypothetical protein